ncbi:CinA family protein [Stappia sp. MMSF_3263]|uniref:CinA family protein n=1 Tax=Stappia sp. MMSF_3263 TaxID=3046693 RepID=UPI0027400095|nr:CinA family protein [Stappia sp. MMSF_3263]
MTDLAPLESLATRVIRNFSNAGWMLATAESCTGGLIAGVLTEISGSSAVVERGFVTYSNEAKTEMLGVPADLIRSDGAVSQRVAIAMAEGALRGSRADVAVSVTGVAGPGGGSPDKPVGLVHFGFARRGFAARHLEKRFGDIGRDKVRLATVEVILQELAGLFGPILPNDEAGY